MIDAEARKLRALAKKQRRAEREKELAARQLALIDRKYNVILADPEWRFEPYSQETGMDRAPENHYPTSPLDAIKRRDNLVTTWGERGVQAIAADDCVLFLWATSPMLPQALEVMSAWGFAYKTQAIWHKEYPGNGRGTGYWFLGDHEILLVGTKGKIPAPAPGTQFRSVFRAPVRGHSVKPDIVYEIIERYYPTVPKIELNAARPRLGWTAWGFEAPSDGASAVLNGGGSDVDPQVCAHKGECASPVKGMACWDCALASIETGMEHDQDRI